jgi:penicillin-binding protein 1A
VITQGTGAGYTYMGCGAEAGKTGTSEDLSDAWFVGYTPLYSTAVWVGHPQSREETGFGGPTAGPIWRSFMESAVAGNCPEFLEPASLPELAGLDSGHTSGSSGSSSSEYEYNEYEEEETTEEPSKGKGGNNEGAPEAESAPEATPEAAPTPEAPASPPAGGGISPG